MNLTKREYFSAMAMQGMLANSYNDGCTQPLSTANAQQIAELAVGQADALIKELNIKDQIESKKRMEEAQIAPAFSHFYDGYMD